MSWIEIIADRKIRDAQEEGAFDDLPGKGKPLKLEFDPRVPPEQRAAYRLMKEAQLLPDWIQLEKEIRTRQEQWQARLEAFARSHAADLRRAPVTNGRKADEGLDRRRDLFLTEAMEGLRQLNDAIDRFNLITPSPSRAKARVNLRERALELEDRFPRQAPWPGRGEPPWRQLAEEDRPPTRLSNRMPLRRKRGSIG